MKRKKKILLILLSLSIMLVACKKTYKLKPYWSIKTEGKTSRVLFVYNNCLYASAGEYMEFGSPNYMIYCLDMKSGATKWLYKGDKNIINHKIALYKDKICIVPTNDGTLIWLDAKTGKKLENINIGEPERTSLKQNFNSFKAVAINGVEATKIPASIVCKDNSGNVLWKYIDKPMLNVKYPYRANFSFLINENILFIGQYNGKVDSFRIE